MTYATILVTEEDGIRTITLNRPERRNAMTPEMQTELIAAMRDAATSPCRVVVFTGVGESFCAGLDLSALKAMAGATAGVNREDAESHRADAERIGTLFRTLYELPRPTIAAVHGHAIAGGTGLATLCDFTLAVPGVKFGYTEARIGFVPAVVSAYLALQIGDKRARDLLLTARLFTAEEALHLGLVSEIVAADRLMHHVYELAATLKANSPESLAATKQLLAAQNRPWLDTALAEAMAAQAHARTTHDFAEGISAFLEKRPPLWKV